MGELKLSSWIAVDLSRDNQFFLESIGPENWGKFLRRAQKERPEVEILILEKGESRRRFPDQFREFEIVSIPL